MNRAREFITLLTLRRRARRGLRVLPLEREADGRLRKVWAAAYWIPRRWWKAVLLVLASYVPIAWTRRVPLRDYSDYAAFMSSSASVVAPVLCRLATLTVLRRPNGGALPAWPERRTAVWPRWLRGAPA